LKDKTEKHEIKKKKQANLDKCLRPGLISRTYNPWNPKPELNQKRSLVPN
jgi:hypothetical protein